MIHTVAFADQRVAPPEPFWSRTAFQFLGFPMQISDSRIQNRFDHTATHAWAQFMQRNRSMRCKYDAEKSRASTVDLVTLGTVEIARTQLAAMELSPLRNDGAHTNANRDWIYLKMVTAGYTVVESAGRCDRLVAGSMLLLDPAQPFAETIPEQASMTVVRLPKAQLRERGWSRPLNGLQFSIADSPDIQAAGSLIEWHLQQHPLYLNY